MVGTPVDYDHGRLYRVGAEPVQGFLERVILGDDRIGMVTGTPTAILIPGPEALCIPAPSSE
jgi:hypothetical protein